MSKALILGITGQDGSYLSELLLSKGYEVHGVIRRSSLPNTGRIDHTFDPESKQFIHYGDLTDGIDHLLHDIKPDEVYNLAAMSHVRISFDVPVYTLDVNATGVCRILEGIRKICPTTKYYQASSSEMFGVTPPPQSETTIFHPVSPYGCFPAGTKILSQIKQNNKHGILNVIGNKNIEDIKEGDLVLTYNEKTGNKEYKKVLSLFNRDSKELYTITLSNGNIVKCTEEHPFFVHSKSWVEAKNLAVGDELIQYKYSGLNRRISNLKRSNKGKTRNIKKVFTNAVIPEVKSQYVPTTKSKNKWKIKDTSKMSHTPWNKGLTKDTDVRVKKQVENSKNLHQSHPDIRKKISNSVKNLWKTSEYRDKTLKAQSKSPNNSETHLTYILEMEFPKEFRYVGNRALFLGHPARNPDWVHITKNKVIEFLGRHWHEAKDETLLKEHYDKCGYDCLVIWEEELKDESALISKVKNFLYNKNTEVVTIVSITKNTEYCKVYNIEVEDNNNYFAYGILVHNCAKLSAYWLTRCYRDGYNLFASNGILFNHESPRRGVNFVTRKITRLACRIKLGLQDKIELGNLEAMRDWGHSRDYMRAIHMILQHDKPDDFVVSTGEAFSVREFAEKVFSYLGLNFYDHLVNNDVYKRPVEVPYLCGDSTKIRTVLGWTPEVSFEQLVKDMVDLDMLEAQKELLYAKSK